MAPKRGSPTLRRAIGKRVRQIREEANQTQETLAWAAGISKASISRIEQGENLPSVPVIFALAAELGVTASDLVGFDLRQARLRLLDAARRGDGSAAQEVLKSLNLEADRAADPATERPAGKKHDRG